MSPYLRTATEIAYSAGRILLRYNKQSDKVRTRYKSTNDPVSNIDYACEQEIVERLSHAYPEHAILTEEETIAQKKAELCWIIDPLDGTRNFIQNIPHFAISIALVKNNRIILGVVYDPLKNEMFCAEKGEGAVLNQIKIRTSKQSTLAGSTIATGIPYRPGQDIAAYIQTLQTIVSKRTNIRRMGVASLDLCYVACSRFDAFWESGLQSWDVAAGILIVREAGGIVKDLQHSDISPLKSGNILASNSYLFDKISKYTAGSART